MPNLNLYSTKTTTKQEAQPKMGKKDDKKLKQKR
jgi:hypothetical protein